MRRRWVGRIGVPALALAVLVGCSSQSLPAVDVVADGTDAAPPTQPGVLVDGGWPEVAAFVADAAAAGDATVVNLFASWCDPCEEELPLLQEAAATSQDVRWVGVAVQDVRANAEPFVERLDVTWPSVLDLDATTHTALEGRVMPTTAFFDAEGRLVDVVHGIVDEERLAAALARAGA